jgi:hypothetical protein
VSVPAAIANEASVGDELEEAVRVSRRYNKTEGDITKFPI